VMVIFTDHEGCCFRKWAVLLIVVCCHELFADCYCQVGNQEGVYSSSG
jgi:hypothetical protein